MRVVSSDSAVGHARPSTKRPLEQFMSPKTAIWIAFVLSTPVTLGCSPVLQESISVGVNLHLNMFTLIALGTSVAYLYSVIAAVFPHIFPAEMLMANGTVAVYFESAAVIVTLVLLGQVMELRARSQTNSAIRSCLILRQKLPAYCARMRQKKTCR